MDAEPVRIHRRDELQPGTALWRIGNDGDAAPFSDTRAIFGAVVRGFDLGIAHAVATVGRTVTVDAEPVRIHRRDEFQPKAADRWVGDNWDGATLLHARAAVFRAVTGVLPIVTVLIPAC